MHRLSTLCATTLLLCAPLAQASGPTRLNTANTPFQQECGSCHTPYAPALLPAASWTRIMAGLDRHFGTDASLDASTTQAIGQWLQSQAGTYRRVKEAPEQDRITRADWFTREHRESKLGTDVWKRPGIGSASNCTACHADAAKGVYNEDAVRIPR